MSVQKGYNRKISGRIEQICQYVDSDKPVYDLCCDHGLIGFFAHKLKNVPKVIFVDQVRHIMDNLQAKIQKFEKDKPFEVLCLPAESITLPETPVTIIAAGVYAPTIYKIIDEVPLARKDDVYIFSPNSDLDNFEKKITDRGFKIISKALVTENNRQYPIYKTCF